MLPDIKSKLNEFLSNPVDTECKAVYLLCQVRKLYKDQNITPTLSLDMHVNWALHTSLDTNPGAKHFLQTMDIFVGDFLKSSFIPMNTPIFDDCLFSSFKKSLKDFLASQGMPTVLCDDDRVWAQFAQAYAGVIEDCSLIWVSKKANLKNINQIIFKKSPALPNAGLPFNVDWKISLKTGKTLSASFNSYAANGIQHVWGFSID